MAFLAFCGDVTPGKAAPDGTTGSTGTVRSGTRLRARVYTSPDGAREFLGWHDSQLQAPCLEMTTKDGKVRCVPSGTTNVFYSDSACSQGLAIVAPCDAPSPFARSSIRVPGACGSEVRQLVWRLKAVTSLSAHQYVMAGADCTETTVSLNDGEVVHALEEVGPETLVQLEESVE